MATGIATFNEGTNGSALPATLPNSGGISWLGSAGANYSNARPFDGGMGAVLLAPGTALAPMRLTITARKALMGAWIYLPTANTSDLWLLQIDGSTSGSYGAALLSTTTPYPRVVTKGSVNQNTNPGVTWPIAGLVWASLFVDVGDDATNSQVRAAIYNSAGTLVWDLGLKTGSVGTPIDISGTGGSISALRWGKLSGGSYSNDIYYDYLWYKTDADVTTTLLAPPSVGANVAPTAAYSVASQTVTAGSTVTATLVGTDTDGTIASYAHSVAFPTSNPPVLANATAATVSFTAPAAPAFIRLNGTVTDNSGATSTTATTEIRVSGSASQFSALATNATKTGTVTLVGGTTTDGEALSDTSATTYLEMSSGSSFIVRATPIGTQASGFSVVFNMATDTGTAQVTVALMQTINTQIQVSSALTITTTPTDYSLPITNVSAVTDWGSLFIKVTVA